jgi:hypothetical protein
MRYPHLSDDRLIEVCLTHAAGAADEAHLASCGTCEARRASLAQLLTDASGVAGAEADAYFTDDRLDRQRARILQRAEQEARQGRVISFPAGHGAGPSLLRARPATRWIAGAAAAGLVIGMLAGHVARDFTAGRVRPASQAAVITAASPQATLQAVSTTLSEEEFLGRLELAVEGTGGTALRPLDDLTPLAWEVAAQ